MMQYPQPMHPRPVHEDDPVGRLDYVAPTGHTWTQGGLSHWLQSLGTKKALAILAGEPP